MAKPFIPTDLASLKPIVEAMIFASEEPLGPRTLLRLLFEEEKKGGGQNQSGETTLFEAEAVVEVTAEPESEVAPDAGSVAEAEGGTEAESAAGMATETTAEIEPETGGEADANSTAGNDEAEGVKEEEERADVGSAEPGEEEKEEDRSGSENNRSSRGAKNAAAGQIGQKELRIIIDELNDDYEGTGRPFRIIEIAGGFQFATTREYGEFVGLLTRDRMRRKLSPAALETLAIVAYRQPVTKPEVEAIRGVNCDQVLLSLLERNLVAISGRAESVGKPLLYSTTDEFLRAFGLNSLNDLPKLRELEELMEEDAHSPTKPEIIPEKVTEELLELNSAKQASEGEEFEEKGESREELERATDGEAKEEETAVTAEEPSETKKSAPEENESVAEIVQSGEEREKAVGEEGDDLQTEDGRSPTEKSDEVGEDISAVAEAENGEKEVNDGETTEAEETGDAAGRD